MAKKHIEPGEPMSDGPYLMRLKNISFVDYNMRNLEARPRTYIVRYLFEEVELNDPHKIIQVQTDYQFVTNLNYHELLCKACGDFRKSFQILGVDYRDYMPRLTKEQLAPFSDEEINAFTYMVGLRTPDDIELTEETRGKIGEP